MVMDQWLEDPAAVWIVSHCSVLLDIRMMNDDYA